MNTIHPAIFSFLKSINEHNTREFFALIRPLYDEILKNIKSFCDEVIIKMENSNLQNISSKQSMFRIYRDARRLSPSDQIYKKNFSFAISQEGKKSMFSKFYVHIESGASFVWGWIYYLESKQLRNLRYYMSEYWDNFRKIILDKNFIKNFGKIYGQKTKPRMKKWTLNLDLVSYKQYLINKKYSDEEVLAENFMQKVLEDYAIVKDFIDFLDNGVLYNEREKSKINPQNDIL